MALSVDDPLDGLDSVGAVVGFGHKFEPINKKSRHLGAQGHATRFSD